MKSGYLKKGALCLLLVSLVVLAASESVQEKPATSPGDPLAELGIKVSAGAVPGYVPDKTCASCHGDLWEKFQTMGMANSFYRPDRARDIEAWGGEPFFHAPSRRFYRMQRRGKDLFFQRFQKDGAGREINAIEIKVDWVMGSGNRTRSYLFRTELGELYQLPVGWYSEPEYWEMSPGFEQADHPGLSRLVKRECMSCHNAYPQTGVERDDHWAPHIFPADLPEGIGCQRCHGPGADHVRTALNPDADLALVKARIVNPARLPAALRNDVCNQCHLLPSVAVIGPRRIERGDYSFRPGESLQNFMVPLTSRETDVPEEEHFEINHHAFRLRQSACFKESGEEFYCLSCHDPHHKADRQKRMEKTREVCLGCHGGHPEGVPETSTFAASPEDCVTCHMPRRRTRDVIHVHMTDHNIQAQPRLGDQALRERPGVRLLEEVAVYEPGSGLNPAQENFYLALGMLRAQPTPGNLGRFRKYMDSYRPNRLTPYLDLASVQVNTGDFEGASGTLDFILRQRPNDPLALEWSGALALKQGDKSKALSVFTKTAKLNPLRPEAHYNLGLARLSARQLEESAAAFEEAVRLRPPFARAHLYLGITLEAQEKGDQALQAYRQALSWDPLIARAYLGAARILNSQGNGEEAADLLAFGMTVVKDGGELKAMLKNMSGEETQ